MHTSRWELSVCEKAAHARRVHVTSAFHDPRPVDVVPVAYHLTAASYRPNSVPMPEQAVTTSNGPYLVSKSDGSVIWVIWTRLGLSWSQLFPRKQEEARLVDRIGVGCLARSSDAHHLSLDDWARRFRIHSLFIHRSGNKVTYWHCAFIAASASGQRVAWSPAPARGGGGAVYTCPRKRWAGRRELRRACTGRGKPAAAVVEQAAEWVCAKGEYSTENIVWHAPDCRTVSVPHS